MPWKNPFPPSHAFNIPQQHRLSRRRPDIALVVVLVVLSAISTCYCVYTTIKLLSLQDYHSYMHHTMGHDVPHNSIFVQPLTLEYRFRETMITCIPTLTPKLCPSTLIHDSDQDALNVAIVAPPGELSQWTLDWIQSVISKAELGSTTHMHLTVVKHVPPFQKNLAGSSFSKIIRLLPTSLPLAAADAIRGTLSVGHTPQVLRLEDLTLALRVWLRYQCRISLLVPYSRLPVLTLDMDSLARMPMVISQTLLNFLNITAQDHGEWSESRKEAMEQNDLADSKDTTGSILHHSENSETLLESRSVLEGYASSLLTWIQNHEHVQIHEELNRVLSDELHLSHNFTSCPSLWNLTEKISYFGRTLIKSLVPICTKSQPCSHPRDWCESIGDVVCHDSLQNNTAPQFPTRLPRKIARKANIRQSL